MAKQDRRGQLDAYERAVLRGPADGATDGQPPQLQPLQVGRFRVGSLGLLGGFFVLALLVVVSRLGGDTPRLAANCAAYALALPAAPVTEHAPVSWSAAGPDGAVVLALDAASLRSDLSAVPLPGRTAQVLPLLRLTSCAGSSVFGVQLPAGLHTATLFRLTRTGPVPVPVLSRPLRVLARASGPAPMG